MQQKQEKPISQKKKARESIQRAPKGKVLLPGGAGGRDRKIHQYHNFDKIKKKLEATGTLDLNDFNNVKDIGMFLDWHNQSLSESRKKRSDEDIHEISKYVVRLLTKNPKHFFMK